VAKLVILFQKGNKSLKNIFLSSFSFCESFLPNCENSLENQNNCLYFVGNSRISVRFGLRSFLELFNKLSHDKHAVSNFYHLASPRKAKKSMPKSA
jgi:hypothetical protein